uniref:Uncharacterized protein n=1 Tax=viral metagenome TaxID=1070528 RepID=A0A6C0E906_9ZZZZ
MTYDGYTQFLFYIIKIIDFNFYLIIFMIKSLNS